MGCWPGLPRRLAADVGKNTQIYNPKALFLEGLLAFGRKFSGVQAVERTHLTPKQWRGRAAFKAQRVARREQRRLATR